MSKIKDIFSALIAVIGWFALGLQLYLIFLNPLFSDFSVLGKLDKFYSYFTILTNLLVAVSLTISLIFLNTKLGEFFNKPSVKTAIAVYIAVVGIVYSLFLRNIWNPQGWQLVADRLLHDVVPVLYLIYWIFAVPKGNLTWKNPLYWLVYPLTYMVFTLIRGSILQEYPYHFVDINQLGASAVFINTIFLVISFFLLGEILVGIDKLSNKLLQRDSN